MSCPSRGVRVAAIVLGALASALPLEALEPGRAITQYVLESWIAKDGAPAGTITGITQTLDGYLWLATEGEGLIRFDGVTFVRIDGLDRLFGEPVARITSLICGRDGALWAGTPFGLARFRGGAWTAFDRGEARDVVGLHETADGAVWYTRHWEGLYQVANETSTFMPLATKPRFVTSDAQGTLWVGGYEGLWRIEGQNRRLYATEDGIFDQNVSTILGDGAGNVWVGFQQGLQLLREGKVSRGFTTRDGLSSDDVSAVFVDRDRGLWVGTTTGGLNRRRGERFESLTKALGLTTNRVTAIYEDREGSLWVGTSGGLNRLRDASLLPIGEAEGLTRNEVFSIVAGPSGGTYVAAGFGGLNWIKDGRVRILPAPATPDSDFTSGFDGTLFASPDGAVWSGHRDGLYRRRDGQIARYPVQGQVTSISEDAQSVVFATAEGAVFRLVDGRPQRYRLADGSLLGPESSDFDYVWMMYFSRAGTLWLATSRGAFAVNEGQVRQVWRKGTLSARSISEDEEGTIWLGTMAGLVRVAEGGPSTFTTREGLPQDDIYVAVADHQGGLWMSGARGIVGVKRQELVDVAQGKTTTVSARLFGAAEGMRSAEATNVYQPTGATTRDGRVWFTTTAGVVVVDPSRIRRNTLPPPVVLEAIVADDKPLGAGPSVRIPAGTERLAISYNGLSLLIPRRVQFKYKLEGYDSDFVEAQTRVAHYTKLPPGDYKFRVIAANNDGVWNEVGASVELRQLPLFYQTPWFALAMAAAVAGSIVGLFRYRARQHRRREEDLQARIREALADVNTLSGLLPICAWCKKVRDDTGYWSQIETYIKDHSEAEFSHGICPECDERVRQAAKARPLPP
jgi:ligand-binding sensor domain-containing protein